LLHAVAGSSSADAVRAALDRLGRNEEVIGFHDALSLGPLGDVDGTAASRIAWWSRLRAAPLDPDESRKLQDAEVWRTLRADERDVVVWHGPHPGERMLALRVCWHLRTTPERIYEVALPAREHRHLAPFYGAVGIVGPDALVEAWPRHAQVTDVAQRARRWARLIARPGDWFRELRGERLVHLPLHAYDEQLIEACASDWTRSDFVVGSVLADKPTNDLALIWRMRELLRQNLLEGRGHENRLTLPEQVRPTPIAL
jgi:hypothetical protein